MKQPHTGEADASNILRTFGAYLARGDYDAAAALFAPDAVYEEPPKFHFVGREALRDFFRDFAERHSNVSFTIRRAIAEPTGTLLAAEWRWEYTRDADGERRAFEGMCFVDLSDGLIANWRGYSTVVE